MNLASIATSQLDSRYNGIKGQQTESDSVYDTIFLIQTASDYAQEISRQEMASKQELQRVSVGWGIFQSVVTGFLGLLLAAVGIIYYNMKGDIDEIKEQQKKNYEAQVTIYKEIAGTRIELVKSIDAVDKQVAMTNQKLEDFLRKK
jgi:hypothetical protein